MKYMIDVPDADRNCLKFVWEDGFIIKAITNGKQMLIQPNSQGLISLARHLLELSEIQYHRVYIFIWMNLTLWNSEVVSL